MKKLCLLMTVLLVVAVLPLFAQVTLQVNWVPGPLRSLDYAIEKAFDSLLGTGVGSESTFVKGATMEVYIDGKREYSLDLKYKESKSKTIPVGNHAIYVRIPIGHGSGTMKSETISFSSNSGRVVFNATPKDGLLRDSLELVNVTSSSQPQTAQAPSTTQNVERLTYYVNGNARTANVVFYGTQDNRYYMDDGGNIAWDARFQQSGGNWSDWRYQQIVQRQARQYVGVGGVLIFISGSSDFYNAREETVNGVRLIGVWQKYSDDQFTKMDSRYVYTSMKFYERR